ncbi:MAG: protein translocase subunit SecD [Myxococcales bacterium]|nr:protein translocase subunit SecD [Myxococcales bacterium]|tara:strand:- start:4147 stop:6225 length:2079 start_codon:yes stop_codon:yes gene_type:complete
MEKKGRFKRALLFLGTVFAILYIIPTFIPKGAIDEKNPDGVERLPSWYANIFSSRLGFGLDLAGGLELKYSVDYQTAMRKNVERWNEDLQYDLVGRLVEQDNKGLDPANQKNAKKFTDLERKAYFSAGDTQRFTSRVLSFRAMRITFVGPKAAEDQKLLNTEFIRKNVHEDAVLKAKGNNTFDIALPIKIVRKMRKEMVSQTLETIRRRVESSGLVEPDVRAAGATQIDIQMPGISASKKQEMRQVLGQTAELTFRIVDDTDTTIFSGIKGDVEAYSDCYGVTTDQCAQIKNLKAEAANNRRIGNIQAVKTADAQIETIQGNRKRKPTIKWCGPNVSGCFQNEYYVRADTKSELEGFVLNVLVSQNKIPADHIVGYEEYVERRYDGKKVGKKKWRTHYLFRRVQVSGERVKSSKVGYTSSQDLDIGANWPVVLLTFDRRGAKQFDKVTQKFVKKRMAIMLDDVVESDPVLQERISGGTARITLGSSGSRTQTLTEARTIVTVLNNGAYKAPVNKVEDNEVGPTLGRDTIEAGVTAMVVGMGLVIIFMLIYYRIAGVVANLALLLNVAYILAILVAFNTHLTLPGIAGMLLTVGMAVDANVIINERVREELRVGRSLRAAIQTGYSRAFWTVFDANITTALAAWILFRFTTGTLHNFAVTLLIGVICSMFTAVYVTRRVFEWMLNRGLTQIRF